MLESLTTPVLAALTLVSSVPQQSAQEVLETMRDRQLERWETIDNYTVFQTMEGYAMGGGMELPMHFQKHDIDGRVAFGIVPPNEYAVAAAQAEKGGEMVSGEALDAYADASVMMADGIDGEQAKSKTPLFPGMDAAGMFRNNASFLSEAANVVREAEAGDYGRSDAATNLAAHDEMTKTLQLVGEEFIGDRPAFLLEATGLDRRISDGSGGGEMTLRTLRMWVDAEHYVLLRLTMEGELEYEGRTSDITLERRLEDYREVGPLFEAHRTVMSMSGLMSAMSQEDREKIAELDEYMEQMDDMERQLSQMPAATRGMMERQMAKVREQMEMLTGSDGFETAYDVLRIEINTGPPPPGTVNRPM